MSEWWSNNSSQNSNRWGEAINGHGIYIIAYAGRSHT
jgi:hypothetical protein